MRSIKEYLNENISESFISNRIKKMEKSPNYIAVLDKHGNLHELIGKDSIRSYYVDHSLPTMKSHIGIDSFDGYIKQGCKFIGNRKAYDFLKK